MPNNGGVYTWSQTAANNATADKTVNWQEGQAPSSINDSGRAMMASVAKFRDDISGSIVTTGTSTAYIVSSNQQFDTLANFNGKMIAFSPHATNGVGPVTMTVDGFANLPLRSAPNTELPSGVLIQGTPYAAVYNATDGALYLQGFYGNLGIPFLGGMDFWDTVTPASNYIFPMGQAISRTVYSAAFARWGTTYGAGDGSTTFNVPDKTGRVSAMMEATATRLTTAGFGGNSTLLGAVNTKGGETETLTATQIPTINSTISGTTLVQTTSNVVEGTPTTFGAQSGGSTITVLVNGTAQQFQPLSTGSVSGTGVSSNTGGGAHPNVQPTIVCNYIIRII